MAPGARAGEGLGDGRVRLAVREELTGLVRDEIRRVRPRATVMAAQTGQGDGSGEADILLVAPHEVAEPDVRRMVRQGRWRWIHLTSAGYDFFRVEDVAPGTVLTRSSRCYAAPVTEYVALALIDDARRRTRAWDADAATVARLDVGLFGQTLGVAGFGAIGRNVVALGALLGMNVKLLTRRPRSVRELPQGVQSVTRTADLLDVDHLVLALPLTRDTHAMFGAEMLDRCKPGLHLVNVARGALVDHDALARAVEHRGVRATLDVTEPEPLPADHALLRLPGVRISPHVAWHSRSSDWSFLRDFLDNWTRWESGEQLTGVVDLRGPAV